MPAVNFRLEPALHADLVRLADKNRRSLQEQMTIMLERLLRAKFESDLLDEIRDQLQQEQHFSKLRDLALERGDFHEVTKWSDEVVRCQNVGYAYQRSLDIVRWALLDSSATD